MAASSLPPPEKGSLREAALASVKRQQADQALQVNKSKRKRQAPSNSSPLAKRMRSDFQIDESEVDQVESPENELLRSHPSLKLKKFLRLLNLLKLNKFLKTQPRGGPPGFATTVMVRGTLPENVFLRGQNTFATTAEAKVTLPETVISKQFVSRSKSMFELMGRRPLKCYQWFGAVLLALLP